MSKREPLIPRTIRTTDAEWDAATARAEERGESVSHAVRQFLGAYADGTEGAIRRFARWLRQGEKR